MQELKLKPGQIVGLLTLFNRKSAPPKVPGGRRTVTWTVSCACSPETKLSKTENALRRAKNGTVRSCGCWRRDRLKLPGHQAAINLYFRQCKARAKRDGLQWELTIQRFEEIVTQDCAYCERPKSRRVGRRRKGSGEFISQPLLVSGIDRADSSLGYLMAPGQCLPCHTRCNSSKGASTVPEFGARRSKKMLELCDWMTKHGFAAELIVYPG